MSSGCGPHEYFDETCSNCALLVSRPPTKDDLPSPFNGVPVDMGKIVIDPSLIEAASAAGKRRREATTSAHAALNQARMQLSGILKTVQKASGQLYVSAEEAKLGDVSVLPHNATVNGVNNVKSLLQLWELVPIILRAHIKNCEYVTERADEQARQSIAIFQGARAVKALVGAHASAADKQDFIKRVMVPGDLADALDAADDTGLAHAATDIIRQQVSTLSLTERFMRHFEGAYIDWGGEDSVGIFPIEFVVKGVDTWLCMPVEDGSPDVFRGLKIEFDQASFELALQTTTDLSADLMNLYFRDELKINGHHVVCDNQQIVQFSRLMVRAYEPLEKELEAELDARDAEDDDEDEDIPF